EDNFLDAESRLRDCRIVGPRPSSTTVPLCMRLDCRFQDFRLLHTF
ncbi:hypothetical protein AVEN_182978-1, partial [Araneus ventricosus]